MMVRNPLNVSPSDLADEVQLEWVPLWRAPMYYSARRHLREIEDWRNHLENIIKTFQLSHSNFMATVSVDNTDQSLKISWRGIVLGLQREQGNISLEIEIEKDRLVFGMAPGNFVLEDIDELMESWIRSPPAAPRPVAEVALHRRFAQHLTTELLAGLKSAVRSGVAHVVARKKSVLVPFSRISADYWKYFASDKEWWALPLRFNSKGYDDAALGPEGDRLFDVHVAPGTPLAPVGGRAGCKAWLIELAQKHPLIKPKIKADLQAEANRLYGVSGRQFEHLWALHAPAGWKKRGSPRGQRKSTR